MNVERAVVRCLEQILITDPIVAHRATVYVSPDLTVKMTRRGKPRRGERQEDFVLTIGKPNWHERQRIKTFQRAGEPFPVKKVQLQFYPPKKR